jgi:hypothetical protein
VLRSHRGFSWLTGGGIKVGTRGSSVMASTAAQCGKRAEEEEGTPWGGGAPIYRRQRRLERAARAAGGVVAAVKLGAAERPRSARAAPLFRQGG